MLIGVYLILGQKDVRKYLKSRRNMDNSNPYDMEDMVMPLHAFINHPIAHEIIHNGATFQVSADLSILHTLKFQKHLMFVSSPKDQ